MPLPRYERLDPAKRAALLSAAKAEFAANGLDGASLNNILATAGLGKSSYYYYFADKYDLFATVIDEAYTAIEAEIPEPPLADAPDAETFWTMVQRHQLAWVDVLEQRPIILALFRGLFQLRSRKSDTLVKTMDRFRNIRRNTIVIGRERGFIRRDIDVELLVAIVEGADFALDAAVTARTQGLSNAELVPDIRPHLELTLDTMKRLLRP